MFIYTLENKKTGKWETLYSRLDVMDWNEFLAKYHMDPAEWKLWDTVDTENSWD